MIGGILSIMVVWAMGQPKVIVQGTLKGYFLSPDGTLSVYEVPFSFPNKPSSPDLPRRLFPFWAGYYLQAKFSSTEKPIQSVWLLSGTGRLLWRRHYPEGVFEETIPYQEEGWVGVKGQDGLFVRLLVRFSDGSETVIRPNFSVRFERVLPLKVDWLDFIRIAEVANLLKEKGREIWEGFSLEGIPFLLEGDEGQWVLVNHPKPPKGFVRYEGPLPKVPFAMKVHFGQAIEAKKWQEEMTGRLIKVNGIWTAALRYFPNWWVLEDCVPPGYSVTREPDPLDRLETIVHESFHVWWFQRVKEPITEGRETNSQAIVLKMSECESLARALEAKDDLEKRRWAKAFLALRQKRRQTEESNSAQVTYERWEEIVEGIPTFVSWMAMKLGQKEDYQPIREIQADENFLGYQQWHSPERMPEIVAEALRQSFGTAKGFYASGLAQAILLSQWKANWQSQLLKGRSLEEILEEVLKDIEVPPNQLTELESSAERLYRRMEIRLRRHPAAAKPPERKVIIWLHFANAFEMLKWMEEKFGEVLPPLKFSLSEATIETTTWTWLALDESTKNAGLFWDADKQLTVLHRPDGTVALQGDGLEVQGKLQVTWDMNGVHVRPAEKAQKATKEGASTISRKKAWHAVVLPVTLLTAIANRDMKAMQEEEPIMIEGTITGVFLNPVTNQFEMATLPLPTDVYLSDEEEYQLTVSITSGSSDSFVKTSQVSFAIYPPVDCFWGTPRQPCSYPQRTIGLKITPDRPRIGDDVTELEWEWKDREPVRLKLVVKDKRTGKKRGEIWVACAPAKEEFLIKSVLNDAEAERDAVKPFGDVAVDLWFFSRKEKQWFKKTDRPIRIDPNGEPLLCQLAPGIWRIVGYKGEPIATCPQVVEEVDVRKDLPNSTVLWFYLHKPVKGQVLERTSSGSYIPLPGAKVSLWKGDNKVSGDWESDSNGYFFIPPDEIDTVIEQHGSGTYTVKVVPPSRSMMRPEPPEDTDDVTLTRCERTKPRDPCPRSLTIDVGTFVFTYKPAYPGPGGQ